MSKITLTSYGATQEVTGSCHLLNVDGFRLLIDCGLYQGDLNNYFKNWEEFGFSAKNINAVILTHAHLDHCGRLPKLIKEGFQGKIYTTPPTAKLVEIVLADNLKIMSEKIAHSKYQPLYSAADLSNTNKKFLPVEYGQNFKINDNISFTLHQAGHILGAAIVKLKIFGKTIIFTGDIGSENMPLVKDIEYFDQADYVIMESTYGDRLHAQVKNRDAVLIQAIQRVTAQNSTLVMSEFAIERAQDILKVLNDYYEKHLDFRVPVYLDSPMADVVTKVYKKYTSYFNDAVQDSLKRDRDIFDFPHLKITSESRFSKNINTAQPPKIILAGSGMADGGRIIHHLAQYASDPKNYILFMGFQVPGTLGHRFTSGAFDFSYLGRKVPIHCAVDQIDGFSAHADQAGLMKWVGHFQNQPKIFLVHGNPEAMTVLAQKINNELKLKADILLRQTSVEL
ncbi:MAG: metallo-beta-lactamase family protein [Patescibacteria group bacterium]|nr:metallo-beta-lactamase family protein [Patescibacteria group bacterium]